MTDQFVTYKIAEKLKALGFNEECFGGYSAEGKLYPVIVCFQSEIDGHCLAPIWQQAIDFFRTKSIYITELVTTYDGETAWKVSDCRAGIISEYGGFKREEAFLRAIELIEKK